MAFVYEETCICDTSNCNTDESVLDFYCHGGDYELDELLEGEEIVNQTHSCYTNRNQCYIMKYTGTVKYQLLNHFQMNILLLGVKEDRVRFGCSPLEFKDLKPKVWTTTGYRTIPETVEAYTCNEHLCNGFKVLKEQFS